MKTVGIRWACILTLSLAFLATRAAADKPTRVPGKLHVLGIAVNVDGVGKPGPLLNSFNWSAEEKVHLFTELGKDLYREVEGHALMGEHVTRAQFIAALDSTQQKAKPGDLVVIYIGMHGGTDRKDGWGVGTVDNEVVRGMEVKNFLGAMRCQVLALIETCGSGGFARDHKNNHNSIHG